MLDAVARRRRVLEEVGAYEGVAEIEYGFDLGPILSILLGPFLPEMRFWLAPNEDSAWIGHQLPIVPREPSLLTLREGLAPGDFGM